MSSRSNLAVAMAGLSAMQAGIVAQTGQALPPVGSPPLAPPVVPTAPSTDATKEGTAEEQPKSNTMLYVGIGVGVVVLIIVAYFILRK